MSGSTPELEVLGRRIQVEAYAVFVTMADPISRTTVRFPVRNEKGIVSAMKRVSEIIRDLDEELMRNPILFSKRKKGAAPGQVALVKDGNRMFVEIVMCPKALVNYVERAKSKVYDWLRANAVVVRARPENLYLVPPSRLTAFKDVVESSKKLLAQANAILEKFWRPTLERIARELEQHCDVSKLPNPPKLDDVRIVMTKVSISAMLSDMVQHPELKPFVKESIRGLLQSLVESLFEQAMQLVAKSKTASAAAQSLRLLASRASSIGLDIVAQELTAVANLIEKSQVTPGTALEELLRKRSEQCLRSITAAIDSLPI